MQKTLVVRSIEELADFARFLLRFQIKPEKHASVLGLYGNLGAGKTALTKLLAQELGVDEHVTSPTFVIQKSYPTAHGHVRTLVHIDAYRLNNSNELAALGFKELLADPGNLVIVEWAERVEDVLPPGTSRVYLEVNPDASRTVSIR